GGKLVLRQARLALQPQQDDPLRPCTSVLTRDLVDNGSHLARDVIEHHQEVGLQIGCHCTSPTVLEKRWGSSTLAASDRKEFDRASSFSLSPLNVLDLMLCGEGQKRIARLRRWSSKMRKCSIVSASTIMGCCSEDRAGCAS